ncbi:MAG: Ig-like domain-containing protein [Anaerovoracaceae bacterium]
MKRIGAILVLSIMLIMAFSGVAMGATFGVKDTSPKNGATGQSIDNMGVKVLFNENVYSKKNQKANSRKCHLVDNKGHKVPSRVAFSEDYKKMMLVVADTSKDAKHKAKIKSMTKYTLVIDSGFKSASGQTMDRYTLSFRTLNSKTSMRISMAMMGVMVVGMIFMTVREQKKQQKEGTHNSDGPVNPYKEAKRTGKSVEEIVARENKKKEKLAREQAKREAKEREEQKTGWTSAGHMRVPGARPISAAGSTFKYPVKKTTHRKSKSTNPKGQSGRQKNQNRNRNSHR